MYIMLILTAICLIMGVTIGIAGFSSRKERLLYTAPITICITAGMWLVMLIIFIAGSYSSYLDIRTFYDSTVEQYSTSVEMYHDMAVINVESAAWTDLKYEGYQSNISNLIRDLRSSIIKYNKEFISKRIMKNNPWFSWLIVAPDDYMKVIKMKTASTVVK